MRRFSNADRQSSSIGGAISRLSFLRPMSCYKHVLLVDFQRSLVLFVAWAACIALAVASDGDTAREKQTGSEGHAFSVPQTLLDAEQQRIDVIANASAATIAVFGQDGAGGGSGVLISSDGFALTNFHVASPCGNFLRCGLPDGVLYDAVIVGIDPTGDVALIKLLGRDDFPTAPLGDSDPLQVGQPCFAAGNPFLLATDFHPTVTWGIISGVRRYQYPAKTLLEYSDCIQTDAAINPGNSGGPLFNEHGNVIGINGRISIEKRGRVNVGVGYAISINQIKKFLGHLHSGRIVDHATSGFTVSSSPGEDVVVTNILETSDAFRRGIRFDDVIVAVDQRPIETANELKNILGTFPQGWRVPVTISRGDDEFTVQVRLTGLHSREELLQMLEPQAAQPDLKPRSPKPNQPKPDSPQPPNKPDSPRPPKLERRAPHGTEPDLQTKVPKQVRKLFVERRGFANYYFNRLHVQRIHEHLREQFDFTDNDCPWALNGTLATGGRFKIHLGATSEVELPSGRWVLDPAESLDRQLVPEASGGLLAALHLLRQFVVTAQESFGDVTYIGTTPLPGHPIPVDVMTAVREALELRLYTHPDSGRLLCVELYADSRLDPCEIHFQYADQQVSSRPETIQVKRGDDEFANLKIEGFECAKNDE